MSNGLTGRVRTVTPKLYDADLAMEFIGNSPTHTNPRTHKINMHVDIGASKIFYLLKC